MWKSCLGLSFGSHSCNTDGVCSTRPIVELSCCSGERAASTESWDLLSHHTPLCVPSTANVRTREVAILCLKVLTNRLRRIHVREILDVVTSVSSQQHIKHSLGFNYPFFWEKKKTRDRKDLNPPSCSKRRFGRGEYSPGS